MLWSAVAAVQRKYGEWRLHNDKGRSDLLEGCGSPGTCVLVAHYDSSPVPEFVNELTSAMAAVQRNSTESMRREETWPKYQKAAEVRLHVFWSSATDCSLAPQSATELIGAMALQRQEVGRRVCEDEGHRRNARMLREACALVAVSRRSFSSFAVASHFDTCGGIGTAHVG